MQTRQILAKIIHPAKQSEEAISVLGTSFGELRDIITQQGLLAGLMHLNDLTQKIRC